jgi:hypothetical protein
VLDLSQPKPDPDLVRKFVSKIVPDGKNTFHWYLNLDGNSAIIQTVMVEGRKNQATVTAGAEDASSVTATVIHIMALLAMAQEEKTCLLGQLHRPPSRANSQIATPAYQTVSGSIFVNKLIANIHTLPTKNEAADDPQPRLSFNFPRLLPAQAGSPWCR